jgi:SAM-dependent methyltransferase
MEHQIFRLHADLEDEHWWFVGRREIMRMLVQWALPPSAESLVLDVGCGTGANIGALAADYKCVGVDPSSEAIRLARLRFPGVTFVRGHAPEDVAEAGESADLFLLMDVLEHVPDDFELLSSILEISKPGALVFLTVPAHPSLWTEHDVHLHHYRRYEMERLREVWKGLAVKELLVSFFNTRLFPVARAVRAMSKLRGRAAGRGGTDLSMPPRSLNALLARTFAGESDRLLALARDGSGRPYRTGLSLMALLERGDGPIQARSRPSHVPPDRHIPSSPD